MTTIDRVLIVGGGLAGAHAAFALRDHGFAGDVVIVGEEDVPPYERPPISKEYLRGERTLDEALVRPAAEYAARDIALMMGRRAVALDVARRRVELHDGSALGYDALIIATGAAPRSLNPGVPDPDGVLLLRDAADADRLRAAAAEASAIAVVGGGWIGSEVAASLRQLGHAVTLVTDRPRPLERVLGTEVAEVYRGIHLEHGVRIAHGHVAELEGRDRVTSLRLDDGRRIAADLVVVGVGAAPRITLAADAGIETRDGAIAVDEYLRTSVPTVYAIGDVASAWHPRYGRHLHVEHWDNAIHQGRAVAANIIGVGTPYARIPYFYSDQFDLGMEYRGHAPAWDEVIVRGDTTARAFHAFWLAEDRVVAAMNVNLWDDGEELQRLVASGAPVDGRRLADPAVPLAEAA